MVVSIDMHESVNGVLVTESEASQWRGRVERNSSAKPSASRTGAALPSVTASAVGRVAQGWDLCWHCRRSCRRARCARWRCPGAAFQGESTTLSALKETRQSCKSESVLAFVERPELCVVRDENQEKAPRVWVWAYTATCCRGGRQRGEAEEGRGRAGRRD